jgi:hypothetical protein
MRLTPYLLLSSVLSSSALSAPFNFFAGRDIDYWQEGRLIKEAPTQEPASERLSGPNILRSQDGKPFHWSNYQDPLKPEFWDDGGDWIPPRPFREAAASPTPENIQAYLKWQKQKAAVVAKFQAALEGTPSKEPAWNTVKVAYFYQSACPHCQASVPLVESLRDLGVQMTLVQMGPGAPLHEPSIPYDQTWAKEFPVSATPTWVIKQGTKVTTRSGALSMAEFKHFVSERKESP